MKGCRMLENQEVLLLPAENNVFVIDWLTVVFHHVSVSFVQALLGMNNPDIPWETEKVFRNGYPMRTSYKHISILWGADDERFYSSDENKTAAQKVRHDMGICLDMSGQGCREFENIEGNDWLKFFTSIQDRDFKTCVTRLDIAYDDQNHAQQLYRIYVPKHQTFWNRLPQSNPGCFHPDHLTNGYRTSD